MFDIDDFIINCQSAIAESEPRRAIKDVVQRAVANGDDIADAFQPTEGGINLVFESSELTILNVVWAPHMTIYPHDHKMWAVIGIYTGQEDNTFYRRSAPGARTLTSSGGKVLADGDVVVLGDDTIHQVTNPLDRLTGALHVYGGDFVHQARSQWGPGPREERPYDLDEARRQFDEANRAWRDAS
jgi:predicted metal-dependent enzyme (double-stranded beta helix superfamily)